MGFDNSSKRTFGIKLLEPKSEQDTVGFPVTTRMCDIDLLNRTGEIKYIDEGETIMDVATITEKKATAKRMREEITTIEQFEAIGTYTEVAEKYQLSTRMVHSYMMSLKYKAEREAKGAKKVEIILEPSLEEVEEFFADTAEIQKNLVDNQDDTDTIIIDKDGNDYLIDRMWQIVGSDLELIRKLYIKRAEEEFKNKALAMGELA